MGKQSTIPVRDEPLKYEIRIPGGLARFWKKTELSPRREREIHVIEMQIMPRMRELIQAQQITIDGQVIDESDVLAGVPVGLTRDESRLLFELNDVCAWAYLKSWTLKTDGAPRPLPASVDEFLDLPKGIYEPILAHAGKIYQDGVNPFTVDAADDLESPTEA